MQYEKELDELTGAIQYPLNELLNADDKERKDIINEIQDELDNLQDRITDWAIFLDDLVKNVSDELERSMP